ncbi:MAG: DUF1858 domain-containing protein [Tissierellia bacterium]|nr:DUF1858 domain-containing protein [Tissierellia bacterium]
MAIIDFNKTVYELCSENEKVAEILAEIGFKDITKPGMLNTAGRFMTIPKGAKGKNFDLEEIKKEFIKRGYEIKE